MAITFRRVGRSNQFGVGERFPAALAFVGETLYMAGAATDAVFTVNPTTGVATRVHRLDTNILQNPQAIVDANGTFYIASGTALFTLDLSDGTLTRIGTSNFFGDFPVSAAGLAYLNNTLYMVSSGSGKLNLYTLDPTTGIATRVGSATEFGVGETSPGGLAVVGDTLYMLGGTNGTLYTLNTTTGVATVADSSVSFGAEISPAGLAVNNSTLYIVGQATAALYSATLDFFRFSSTIDDQTYTEDTAISTLTLPATEDGVLPVTYAVSGLPRGLTFNARTRQITGTPTDPGTFTVTYTATDSTSGTAQVITLTFTITVRGVFSFSEQVENIQSRIDVAIDTLTLPTSEHGIGSITYSVSALPSGLAFNPSTRQVTGTPTATGLSTITYTATDSTTPTPQVITQTFTISILSALPPPIFSEVVGVYVYQYHRLEYDLNRSFRNADSFSFPADYTPPSYASIVDNTLLIDNPTIEPRTVNIQLVGTNTGGSVPGDLDIEILASHPFEQGTPLDDIWFEVSDVENYGITDRLDIDGASDVWLFSRGERLYALMRLLVAPGANIELVYLCSIDTDTGVATIIRFVSRDVPDAVEYDASTDTIYMTSGLTFQSCSFLSGTFSEVGQHGATDRVFSLFFHNDILYGVVHNVGNFSTLISIDLTDGQHTVVDRAITRDRILDAVSTGFYIIVLAGLSNGNQGFFQYIIGRELIGESSTIQNAVYDNIHNIAVVSDVMYGVGGREKLYQKRFPPVLPVASNFQWVVDEGKSSTLDLSTLTQYAESYSFVDTYEPPDYLTLSGSTLSISRAPFVDEDTPVAIPYVATNINGDSRAVVTLVIRNLIPTGLPISTTSDIVTIPTTDTLIALEATSERIYLAVRGTGLPRIVVYNRRNLQPVTSEGFELSNEDFSDCALISNNAIAFLSRDDISIWDLSGSGPVTRDIQEIELTLKGLAFNRDREQYVSTWNLPSRNIEQFRFTVIDAVSLIHTSGLGGVRIRDDVNDVSSITFAPDRMFINYRLDTGESVMHIYASLSFVEVQSTLGMEEDLSDRAKIAYSAGQLIVANPVPNAIKLYFFGDAALPDLPPPPGTVKQYSLFDKIEERFDLVREGSPITVIKSYFKALRQTSTEFVDLPGAQTLQERLDVVNITPKYTIPDARVGDFLFIHAGEPTDIPSVIPDVGRYEIIGIDQVGNNYRQSFICEQS